MEAGIPVGKAESSIISSFLEEALVSNNGVVGFGKMPPELGEYLS